jgi:hypothetical protein
VTDDDLDRGIMRLVCNVAAVVIVGLVLGAVIASLLPG